MAARFLRSGAASPVPLIAISTFSIALSVGSSRNSWNTMPILLRLSVVHSCRSLHLPALPQHTAASWIVEPGHDVDEAALAAAARPDDRDELAARDLHVDPGERHDRAVVEDPADVIERDQRRGRHCHALSLPSFRRPILSTPQVPVRPFQDGLGIAARRRGKAAPIDGHVHRLQRAARTLARAP